MYLSRTSTYSGHVVAWEFIGRICDEETGLVREGTQSQQEHEDIKRTHFSNSTIANDHTLDNVHHTEVLVRPLRDLMRTMPGQI
jgi:hypothetical protein